MLKFIILILLVSNSYAYDYKVKDNRGRTIGYLNKDDKVIDIIDLRGRKNGYIEEDEIKDKYGNTNYYIEED